MKDCAKETNLGVLEIPVLRSNKGYQSNKEYKGYHHTSVIRSTRDTSVIWSTRDTSVIRNTMDISVRGSTDVRDCAKETYLKSIRDTSVRKYKGFQCNKEYKGDLR